MSSLSARSSKAIESHKKINHSYCLCHHCTCIHLLSNYYCNSLLVGLPKLSTIQSVLNAAARLIARLPTCRFTHMSTYMTEVLHWLPIPSRIKFKVLLLLVSKSQLGLAPSYLTDFMLKP